MPADRVHDAAGQPPRRIAVGLEELELQRRAAAVDDEDFHFFA